MEQKIIVNLEDKSTYLVGSYLKYTSPCILLLQVMEPEDNEILMVTPGCKNNY